jgi:fumarate reductase flavoprotein subunit
VSISTIPELPTSVDVIVIGGGLAGHCAALEAADRGATVLLIEKQDSFGGSSILSSGSFAFAGTAEQAEAGYSDDDAMLAADLMKASGGLAEPALIDLYVRRQREDYLWLKQHGIDFLKITLSSNQAIPRTHPTDPAQMMGALNAHVVANPGIVYLTGVQAKRLITREDGRICGISLAANGRVRDVTANKGVILASGGFSRDAKMVEKFVPRLGKGLALGGEGNVGDGLLMAWSRGADIADMAHINGTFGISLNHYPDTRVDPGDNPLLRMGIYKGAIAVNRLGRRFADESISYKILGEICLAQPDGIGFQIWDQPIMDQSQAAPNSNDIQGAFEAGLVFRADSIRGLADLVGIDGDALEQTVARYNAGAANGRDEEFGRTTLGKNFGRLVPIVSAPFYIYPCTTAILATYCGIRVDDRMRVLDVYDSPIEGLYAAGEIVGGFHGSGYMSGSSLSKSAIFGRVAGATVAGANV